MRMRCNRRAGTLQTSGQSIIRSRPCSRHALIPTVPMSRSRRAVSPYGPKNKARKTFHNVLDYLKIGPWRLSDDSSGLKDSLESNYVYRTELSLATSIRIREAASDSSSASRHPYELALQLHLSSERLSGWSTLPPMPPLCSPIPIATSVYLMLV
jgi:hypothetical protein